MRNKISPEERLKIERRRAYDSLMSLPRLERHLAVLKYDCQKYLRADLKNDEVKSTQFYFDFLVFFDKLREMMKENKWSIEFLRSNGIDFISVKKLYFAVC
jgi:hypothetical protein